MSTIEDFIVKTRKFLKNIHPNYMVFAVFLGISSFFWLLNELSKEYTIEVPLTIEFVNIPQKFTLLEPEKQDAVIEIKSTGISLLKYYFFKRYFPLEIDVLELQKDSLAKFEEISISTFNSLSDNIDETYNLISVTPSSLSISLSKNITKRLPVKSEVTISCNEDYDFVEGYSFSPDSITITGPKKLLDTIKYVTTDNIVFSDITSSIDKSYDIKKHPLIKYEKSSVDFFAEVGELDEYSIESEVLLVNFPKKIKKNFEDFKVEIEYKTLENFEDVNLDSMIEVFANYKKRNTTTNEVPIEIKNMPAKFSLISIKPSIVQIKKVK